GSQGLFLCQALLETGIVPAVREPHEGRRELALDLGAAPAQPGRTVDHVFETSGVSEALESAAQHLTPGGRATLVGMDPAAIALSSHAIVTQQWSIAGSLIYDHPDDFAETIAMVQEGALAPHHVLQARFTLDSVAEAFAAV